MKAILKLHKIILHILPAYLISLMIGAVVFCLGFSIDPPFSIKGLETDTSWLTIKSLYWPVLLGGATIVSPLALIAIFLSEYFSWKNWWVYVFVSNFVLILSFGVFVFLNKGLPWVLYFSKPGGPFSLFETLSHIDLNIWISFILAATISGLLYWFLAGRRNIF